MEISDRWVAEKHRNLYYSGGVKCYLLEDIAFCIGRIKDGCLYVPKGILPDSHKDWGSNTDVGSECLFRELKIV